MAILTIVVGEDAPILRKKTEKIPKVTKEILKLIKDMQETVKSAEGAGLAAPQIGKSLRLCLAMINGKHIPLINPEITWRSEETTDMEEGCLSLPGVWLKISRPFAITISYLDTKGNKQERKCEGFESHVVQHEIDHLEGVLIVDYPKDAAENPVHTAESVL